MEKEVVEELKRGLKSLEKRLKEKGTYRIEMYMNKGDHTDADEKSVTVEAPTIEEAKELFDYAKEA